MNEKMNATLGNAFPKERIRYAMLSFFLAQGLCFSSWASRIPDVKDIFEVNYAFYWGLVLFLIPVGVVLWRRSVCWGMPWPYLR